MFAGMGSVLKAQKVDGQAFYCRRSRLSWTRLISVSLSKIHIQGYQVSWNMRK